MENGIHDHQRMTESEITCLVENQKLKVKVSKNKG